MMFSVFLYQLFSAFLCYLVLLFCIFVLFWMISLLKMAPKYSAEMLSRVPECKKAAMCLIEKIYVLDKFHPRHELTGLLAISSMLLYIKYSVFKLKHT